MSTHAATVDSGAAQPARSPAWAAALAGMVAAGAALATGELLASLMRRVPSPVVAVDEIVVDLSPPAMKDFAIATFGTNDKIALAIGTVVIVLAIGAFVGWSARDHFGRAVGWFVAFGIIGVAASLDDPLTSIPLTVVTAAALVAAGLAVLRLLLDRLPPVKSQDEAADGSRRRFLLLAAGLGTAAVISGTVGRRLLSRSVRLTFEDLALPEPVRRVAPPGPAEQLAVAGLTPVVVPNDEFYRIDTALVVPAVDPSDWTLDITGMVRRPLTFTLDDLKNMPLVEEYVTIACVSNTIGGGLVGNAAWTGVRLADLLEEAGVMDGADQIVGRSVDGFTVGFPTEVALDGREALVALGMNGEALPPRHGYPARLIVPGLYGYVSATKWLSEIELTTWDGFDAYWVPRGWSKEGPIKTQSRIDVPRHGDDVAAGPVIVAGVAWAPTRGIARVEVQADAGPWQEAELSEPLSDTAWVQWQAVVDLAAGTRMLRVRATDGTGETQTAEVQSPRPDGASGHHEIRLRVA